MRLVLASTSPRRVDLLRAAGFAFDTIAADVDEEIRGGELPAHYVRRLAAEKSAAVLALLEAGLESEAIANARLKPRAPRAAADARLEPRAPSDLIVLGADTTVVIDGEILGKPRNDAEVAGMLRRLSGRWHQVLTGISLRRGNMELGRVETTRVEVASLTPADVDWYVRSGEGRDKAGAYAIQGLASRFIPRIEGSYTNVVGLPIPAVVELLPEIRHRKPENP